MLVYVMYSYIYILPSGAYFTKSGILYYLVICEIFKGRFGYLLLLPYTQVRCSLAGKARHCGALCISIYVFIYCLQQFDVRITPLILQLKCIGNLPNLFKKMKYQLADPLPATCSSSFSLSNTPPPLPHRSSPVVVSPF